MPLTRNIEDLRAALPAGRTLLGLDLARTTIGLAGSDPGLMLASPLGTIRRTKLARDLAEIARVIEERDAGGVVVGYPVNMDGSEGPRCQAVRQFARDLAAFRPMPILLWDERWSSRAVERAMLEGDLSRKKRAARIDALAAAYILQGALDALRAKREHESQT